MTSASPIIQLSDVSVDFGTEIRALVDVQLEVPRGQYLGIAGPNGGGKTTLLRTLLGLQRPTTGSVQLFGLPIDRLGRERRRIGYLRQRSELRLQAPTTVEELVMAGRTFKRGMRLGPLRRADREHVHEAIQRVGLAGRERAPVRSLSGGQQQRVFLAKLLSIEPDLLVLDEPTTGVDAASQESFAELLCELRAEQNVTIVYVSHEFGAVESHIDRLLIVNGGITFDGRPEQLPVGQHDPSHTHAHAHTHAPRPEQEPT